MKSFQEYLTESKKTYAFRIKVAGDLSEDFNSKLKSAMEKFAVVKMSSGKRTPVQEVPLDFPQLKNTNVTVFEVEVSYPTTSQVLETYVSQVCGVTLSNLKVKAANEPTELYQTQISANKEKSTLDDTLLNTVELGGESAQDKVGQKHISNFLKDLAAEAKTRACEGQPIGKANNMPEPGASTSPIGSKARKGK